MSGPSLGKGIQGQVVNVSGSGMRVHLLLPVPVGVPVEIHDRTILILGEISRCVPDGDGYAVGIRVMQTVAVEDEELITARAHS
jgi:PilZ domain